MTINERIKALREDNDLTQTELAKIIHSNQRRISRIERKDTEITHEEIFEYCFYFKVSADYLLGLPEVYPTPNDKSPKKGKRTQKKTTHNGWSYLFFIKPGACYSPT